MSILTSLSYLLMTLPNPITLLGSWRLLINMPCYGCARNFSFMTREVSLIDYLKLFDTMMNLYFSQYGCVSCGFAFCSSCLKNKTCRKCLSQKSPTKTVPHNSAVLEKYITLLS